MCAAMETAVELDYSAVLPDVNPVQAHQQGMSPNTASATAVADVQEPTQDVVGMTGNQGQDGGVAVRTMAVAVATGQSDWWHSELVGCGSQPFWTGGCGEQMWALQSTRLDR